MLHALSQVLCRECFILGGEGSIATKKGEHKCTVLCASTTFRRCGFEGVYAFSENINAKFRRF